MLEPPLISAMAAVMGSLVGGSASITTAWLTQRKNSRREMLLAEFRSRETLYNEFIAECSRLAIHAYTNSIQQADTLLPAFALLHRIRLSASDDVVAAADRTVRRIADQYFSRNLTLDEMHELARSAAADPLREFSEACRDELRALRRSA
jgi:hypothetical protein